MKKVLLVLAVMMFITTGIFAQSGNGNQVKLINKAKHAAQAAGCLDNWNGPVEAVVTVLSTCVLGEYVTEVLIVPVCGGKHCNGDRLVPLARVMFYCSDNIVGSVSCLR